MLVTGTAPIGQSFGTVPVRRAYYHADGSPGLFPLDSQLNLPEWGYSYVLQELSCRLAVKMSYEETQEILHRFFPVKNPIRSSEGIVGEVVDETERFYEKKAPLEICPEAVATIATVDKKGVVIRKVLEDEAGPEVLPGNPDKPGKKKMATVISTYVTPRYICPADCILKEDSDQGRSDLRPKPQSKVTWGSLTDEQKKTVARLKKTVEQRFPEGNELVCILDGEKSLWSLVYKYFPTAFLVRDICHVLEHLVRAALCFHDEGSLQAREFVTERLRMLLNGRAGRLIGGLKQMLTKQDLSGTKRRSLEQVIGYLERNGKHMRYEICLTKGYPVGSGFIKCACRNLINDRLELTGMIWTVRGAVSIMRLRAIHMNKDWDAFWTYRRKSERRRLYGIEDSSSSEIREQELPCAA